MLAQCCRTLLVVLQPAPLLMHMTGLAPGPRQYTLQHEECVRMCHYMPLQGNRLAS